MFYPPTQWKKPVKYFETLEQALKGTIIGVHVVYLAYIHGNYERELGNPDDTVLHDIFSPPVLSHSSSKDIGHGFYTSCILGYREAKKPKDRMFRLEMIPDLLIYSNNPSAAPVVRAAKHPRASAWFDISQPQNTSKTLTELIKTLLGQGAGQGGPDLIKLIYDIDGGNRIYDCRDAM